MLFKLVVPEAGTDEAERLWASVLARRRLPVAPEAAWSEVGSALLRRTRQGLLPAGLASEAWAAFRDLPLVFISGHELADRAWILARRWHLPTLYDAAFLAAGEDQELWTADGRLLQALAPRVPEWVHLLGPAS